MKFVITGGGTAGHVNPALAVAQELRAGGHEIHYAGTPQGFESKLIPQEGFDYKGFAASGFNRRKPLSLFSSSAKIAVSAIRASGWLKAIQPDAVVGFGGYVSIPVGLAASWQKIPLAIHEQNSTSGMANRFLAKRAQLIALSYASAAKDFGATQKVHIIGNPVRASLFEVSRQKAREYFGLPQNGVVLLVFGGSLGALHLNQAISNRAAELMEQPKLSVLHITGSRDFSMISEQIEGIFQTNGRWRIIEYCDRMGEAYAAADAVLSRAGATTLAEIAALGKPALLVPYPHAAADEQTTNAKSLVDVGAADMIADIELDSPLFAEKLIRLTSDEAYRAELKARACMLGNARAREEMARLIIALASGERW